MNNKITCENKLKVLSLFSGIGAFERALDKNNVDYELVNYCEFDSQTAKAYSLIQNIDISKNLGDITKVNEKEIDTFNLMTYGFPCQSFSVLGERLGFEDEKNGNLFFESMRIAKHHRPKYLVAENVKGLLSHDKGQTFSTILKTLESIGYNNYYKVLNSINFDIPQNRERIFIVSIRKDIDDNTFQFDEGVFTNLTVSDFLDFDLPRKSPKETLIPHIVNKNYTKKYTSLVGIVKLFDGCKEGYFKNSFCANRIYSINGVCSTLTTRNSEVFSEIKGHLTQRERFALQGFKKEEADLLEENGIPKGKIDKISGNTITVNVLSSIFKQLLEK